MQTRVREQKKVLCMVVIYGWPGPFVTSFLRSLRDRNINIID